MQTDLRLILLIIGLCVVGIIFLDGAKRRKNSEHQKNLLNSDLEEDALLDKHEEFSACAFTQKNPVPPQIIGIQLVANREFGFSGKALLAMITQHQMQHNAQKLYDRYNTDKTQIFYTLASIIEPGTFDRQRLAQKNYPGVMLFMRLDESEVDYAIALETLLNDAYEMAEVLDAEVCDLQYNLLSEEQIEHFRSIVQTRTVA